MTMSPWCRDGCAERPDSDPFHYYYHLKSAESCPPEGLDSGYHTKERHAAAASWLKQHDCADPFVAAAAQYMIPTGAVMLSAKKGGLNRAS